MNLCMKKLKFVCKRRRNKPYPITQKILMLQKIRTHSLNVGSLEEKNNTAGVGVR